MVQIQTGVSPDVPAAPRNEKWLIILLVCSIGIIVLASILLYGSHWIRALSVFI